MIAAGGTVDKGLGSKDDLPSFCPGFHQVAIIQAHLDAEADGNGYLAFALNFYGRRHSVQPLEARNSGFLKRSIAARSGAVKELVCTVVV